MYFTTTRAHQELAGGTFHDVIIDEAHDPASEHPFKGDVDLDKLDAVVREVGAARVPYVSIGATVNMAGGQPISLDGVTGQLSIDFGNGPARVKRVEPAAIYRNGVPVPVTTP